MAVHHPSKVRAPVRFRYPAPLILLFKSNIFIGYFYLSALKEMAAAIIKITIGSQTGPIQGPGMRK